MPTEERMVQRISDWSNGPWGILGPYKGPEAGFLFDSIGMQPYTNGMLGPYFRPLNVHTYTGQPFQPQNYRGMIQNYNSYDSIAPTAIIGLFFNSSASLALAVNCLTNTGFTKGLPSAVTGTGYEGFLATDPGVGGRNHFIQIAAQSSILSAHETIAAINSSASPLTKAAIPDPAVGYSASGIIAHRDRYWVWGDATLSSRFYWSNVGALTFNPLNFSSIGAASAKGILGLWSLFDTLLFYMEDYSWWSLRYTDDPALGELKYIGHHLIPDYHVSVGTDGSNLYFTGRDEGIVVISPEGIDRNAFAHMRSGEWGAARRGVHVRQSDIMILPRFEGISFMQVNKVWWKLPGFGMKLYDAFEYSPTEYGIFGYSDDQGTDIFTNKTWNVAKIRAEMAISDLPEAYQGDVDFAAWRAPEGGLAAIQKITVEFSGVVNQSQFEVHVGYIHNGVEVAQTKVADLATAGVVTGMNRFVFHPTRLPMATSFRISLRNCYRAALSEVLIHYDVQNQEAATNTLVA